MEKALTHRDSDVEEDDTKHTHHQGRERYSKLREPQNLSFGRGLVDMPLVNIVGQNTGDSNQLSSSSRGDSQLKTS